MKQSGERLTSKLRKRAPQTAAAAILAKDIRTPARVNARRSPVKTAEKVKVITSEKFERQVNVFVAFSGSSVMAHDLVMKGVSGRALDHIWESAKGALPVDDVLKAIGVSTRTAHRIKADPDKPLDARTTDGIYRLESVRALAEEVLGSTEAAHEWLNTEAMGLEFRKPLHLLSTSPGAEAVKTLLQRMKYGVYA